MSMTTRSKRTLQFNLDYLAGFFDGEGSIFIAKMLNKKSGNYWYRLTVSCANSISKPIQALNSLKPGQSNFYCYRPKRKATYLPQYQWLATGNVALYFLKKIQGKLVCKQEQARIGIEFQNWRNSLPNTGKKRTKDILKKCEGFRQKLKSLKKM